jgi:hypothetical protein
MSEPESKDSPAGGGSGGGVVVERRLVYDYVAIGGGTGDGSPARHELRVPRPVPITGADSRMNWIPCSERLPPEGRVVLFYVQNQKHREQDVIAGQRHGNYWSVAYDQYEGETFAQEVVTHWMPFPEPPITGAD